MKRYDIMNIDLRQRVCVYSFIMAISILACSGCAHYTLPKIVYAPEDTNITYKDVKPLLDKRCVVCHSCYNSPCQAKLSSFDGIDRGATKLAVYNATRLHAQDPTRLFVDAQTTKEWRKKGFFSITRSFDVNSSTHSLMGYLLHDKMQHPQVQGNYSPEYDTLICPRDKQELGKYFAKKPYHGMPYGFPALQTDEYNKLQTWLAQGAHALKKVPPPSQEANKWIQKFEILLNNPDPKYRITARYLYEHLYLAHIYFPNTHNEFYQLVRSKTQAPKPIDPIATLRPFDDPDGAFYYRFEKVRSTIVHKTHMVVSLDQQFYQRVYELFLQPQWREKPHLVSYDPKVATNPFIAFKQIPPESRYRFLLEHAHYIVMTFIRGPVCRGQMALNVIHDHFWVMFQDPSYDIGVIDPSFLDQEASNLALPILKVDAPLIKTFSNKFRDKYEQYYRDKITYIKKKFPQGFGYESLYKGEFAGDAPVLTIYRHFDSASVHKGVLGELPRTMWVIDYAQLERIYYNLVAGYDVFGNVSHQTNIRRYMDFLRIEGEVNFLNYMPKNKRLKMLQSWYINDNIIDKSKYQLLNIAQQKIKYKSDDEKREFIEHFVHCNIDPKLGIDFDVINYQLAFDHNTTLPNHYNSLQDYLKGAKAVSVAGSGFISYMTDSGANNIFLRIDMPDGSYIRKSLVINRWHDNVNSMFTEQSTLNPLKDTMDILDGSVGSYPNVFAIVRFEELPQFLHLMKYCSGTPQDIKQLKHFFISRSDKDFWKIYDWFQNDFLQKEPVTSGLYDLNRYARKPWRSDDAN